MLETQLQEIKNEVIIPFDWLPNPTVPALLLPASAGTEQDVVLCQHCLELCGGHGWNHSSLCQGNCSYLEAEDNC